MIRTIRDSFARYFAILTIIALGVGFFAGLKVTRTAMVKTADAYLSELKLYDLRLISTLGLTEEDVQAMGRLSGVDRAVGAVSADVIVYSPAGADRVLHAHSLTPDMNCPALLSGRMPEAPDECLLDSRVEYTETVTLSENNPEDTSDKFTFHTYRVVGVVDSPLYMNFDRGTTALAGGSASGFVYLMPEGFTADCYTEVYLAMPPAGEIYSDAYDSALEALRQPVKDALAQRAEVRYDTLLADAQAEIADAQRELDEKAKELEDAQKEIDEGWERYRKERQDGENRLWSTKNQLDQGSAALAEGKQQLAALENSPAAALPEVQAQITAARQALAEQEQALSAGLAAYWSAWQKAQDSFRETEKTLTDAQQELEDARPELEEAQGKIDEAREKLGDIRPADTYVLDRMTNLGYACFENDISIVSGVAKVFPLFFFLVAAMVCITTMTRMISEKRTENGVLKALGYSMAPIAGQFLFYAGSASVLGCFAGFYLGSRFLPLALWQVYRILYAIERPIAFVLDWELFALCSCSYLVCALGTTWLVCRADLTECSAALIRPKAPSAGKRVFLERIAFLWKRIRFLHKVSIRNILRYKKRMVMMIVGIGGCTALLLTGFGIRDTIRPILDYQFSEITLYHISATFSHGLTEQEAADFCRDAQGEVSLLREVNGQVMWGDTVKEVATVVFESPLRSDIDLHRGKEPVQWPEPGEIAINYRFATENRVELGDKLTVTDGDVTLTLTVSGIFDNYLYDRFYIHAGSYPTPPEQNTAYVRLPEGADHHAAGGRLLNLEPVASISVCSDMAQQVGGMLDSLNYVVLIVLVCAGALAFIVLYNLTNIMITERTRELATLKVLGFYLKEQNAYIFRENLVLTLLGILCGIPMGIALLQYVMAQIKISTVYFGWRLATPSYFLAGGITLAFALTVDLALTVKTKSISMTEAMKAIE